MVGPNSGYEIYLKLLFWTQCLVWFGGQTIAFYL